MMIDCFDSTIALMANKSQPIALSFIFNEEIIHGLYFFWLCIYYIKYDSVIKITMFAKKT